MVSATVPLLSLEVKSLDSLALCLVVGSASCVRVSDNSREFREMLLMHPSRLSVDRSLHTHNRAKPRIDHSYCCICYTPPDGDQQNVLYPVYPARASTLAHFAAFFASCLRSSHSCPFRPALSIASTSSLVRSRSPTARYPSSLSLRDEVETMTALI